MDGPNPGLEVSGIGRVGLPLSERDALALAQNCSQGPFGKGERILTDTSVRKRWELDPTQFSLRNPSWNQFIAFLRSIVRDQLGLKCNFEDVSAQLYKLLLYEEGAFSNAHQNSEPTPGMFGTLVVCLPSHHQGGSVVLSHHKKTLIFDSSRTSEWGTSFAAWYSDVSHEVPKVISGYRLVLAYNLLQQRLPRPPKAPTADEVERIARLFDRYNSFFRRR